MRARDLLLLSALAMAAVAGPARAGQQDSETLFAEGRRLRLAGDCAGAISVFQRALAAWPDGLGALRNVAECQGELGMAASARRSWWKLRAEVLRVAEDKYKGWDADAEQEYAKLAPKVARLVVRIEAREPARVKVALDGEPLERALWGSELERDPGAHAIEATAGSRRAHESVVLGEGDRREVTLRLADEAPPLHGPNGLLIGAGVALGVAGLGGVGMAIAGALRQSALHDLGAVCDYTQPGVLCPATAQDPIDRGTRAATSFNAFAAVAGAGAVVGGTLLVVALTRSELKPAAAVSVTPGGAFVAARVSF